jgi:xanthine dehydrogenase accessory factor
MDNSAIFEEAASVLETGANVALVTVTATVGSTPGKVGYKMLVWAKGRQTSGTVGGGLVEAEMIEQAARMLAKPGSRTFRFNLGDTADDEKGICGGSVEFLIEVFDKNALPLFHDLVEPAADDESAVLVSMISPDAPPRKTLTRGAPAPEGEFSSAIVAAINDVAAGSRGAVRVSAGDDGAFIESLSQPPTVVLLGAGHLAYHIARYAKVVHFAVTVYDDRHEYANKERFPDADTIVVGDFEHVLDSVRIDERSYVVIVTRGHKHDEIVLRQALRTNARYIGMIGSKRKTQTILDKLRQKGFSDDALSKVYSPIGLAIGAVTPEEIALSIVCELVKIRRLGRAPAAGHMTLTSPGGCA